MLSYDTTFEKVISDFDRCSRVLKWFGCRVHPNLVPYVLPRLAVYFWRIIGHIVVNRVYGPNNPLGNECHSEIVGSEIIALFIDSYCINYLTK
jgi:hypothetical protein